MAQYKRRSQKRKPRSNTGGIDWSKQEAQARRDFDRNVAQINAGETFKSQARTGPQKSPSSNRDGKYA